MPAFLQQVANYIKENFEDYADICIVMPNRRAGLYLKKYLAEGLENPEFAPDIFSVEDFFVKISGQQLIDPIGLLFSFYEVHLDLEKDKAQPFGEFIHWARTLLSDFNEIDAHLVDAKQLFSYLSDVKAIEKWDPEGKHLTELEKEYLAFYQSLYSYYKLLRQKLAKINTTYQGMIWRQLAENPEMLNALSWKKILFVGFNALTRSEEVMIEELKRLGKAVLLWDADEYYLHDTRQEAGYFLRKQLQKSSRAEFLWAGEYFKESVKEFKVTGVPKKVAQARVAASILKEWMLQKNETKNTSETSENKRLDNVALVLADESLLIPVLNALPDDIGDFNVTMGFPVKHTNLYQLLVQVIRLYENAERFGKLDEGGANGFYYFDLIRIFQQPYFSYVCDTSNLVHDIKLSNRVFYKVADVIELYEKYGLPCQGIFAKIFSNVSSGPLSLIDIIVELLAFFRDRMIELRITADANAGTELEYLYQFSKIITRLKGLFEAHPFVKSIKTLREIFNSIAMVSRIPFYGEPLKGLQMMGMLETRNLDFDKIILLSVNEGTLPSASIGNSFIPFDIQQQFGLPTFREKNAVFAYHFYRLLQRATDVHLIYNTESNDLGGGEKSRFIMQLQQEMPDYNNKINFVDSIENLPAPEKKVNEPIVIDKSEEVYRKLLMKAEKGLSPTSLNRYRRCPMQFYLQDIVRLEENEEVEETMEARTIGLIVHETLEKLYNPYKGRQLASADISDLKNKLENQLAKTFENQYAHGEIRFGKNRLIYEVIMNFLTSYLNYEFDFLKKLESDGARLTILKLEEEVAANLQLSNGDVDVRLHGNIDRLDELDGVVRVIDYKTGEVKPTDLTLTEWGDFNEGNKLDKAFQVLMYAWLVQKSSGDEDPYYESGVISMRKLSDGFIKFGIKQQPGQNRDTKVTGKVLQQFEEYLLQLIEELFDQGIPFEQTKDIEVCERCNFNNLCSRV
jgi:hypothetical protein